MEDIKVMANQMLICQALDERDFLRKKIVSAIANAKFIGVKRVRDTKVDGKYEVKDFEESARADYQSINDMIKRYQAIDSAITLSNATTKVTAGDREMTVAGAIALRNSLKKSSVNNDFVGLLLSQMKHQFDSASVSLQSFNLKADEQAELQKMALIGKDSKKTLDKADMDAIATITDVLRGELIDPLNLEDEIKAVSDSYDKLVQELETAIKVSNAITLIEV